MHELFAALRRGAASRSPLAFADDETSLAYGDLAARVAGFAEEIAPLPRVLGLMGGNQVDWVVAQLAAWLAGKLVVPLPAFFKLRQLQHTLSDAGAAHVLCTADSIATARLLGVPFTPISERHGGGSLIPVPGGGQLIYTSGSTGRPKGVRLESGQLAWSAAALKEASGATSRDIYLSVLPFPLLLETIAAIIVPILAGACAYLDPGIAEGSGTGRVDGLAQLFSTVRPTCSVLVPQLLAAWVAQLAAADSAAPSSLRFVAVGGADVPSAVAARAWELGIPVYEGYGLSECGSVVAVNRPDCRKPGTVGRPLPGLTVRIDRREIVVAGPSVMDGYITGEPARRIWRTGDLGEFDDDGYLRVYGRVDNLLVTSFGRNISPEWIESLLANDPRVARAVVLGHGRPYLSAILVPSPAGARWFAHATPAQIRNLMAACCRDAPDHAVPRDCIVVSADEFAHSGFVTANGRVRRAAVADHYAAACNALYAAPEMETN